jgi:3-methyladenine DNA glycosylase AlkD
MVDRAAPYVVGGYLFDPDKKPLYDLAKSINPMENRTAIVNIYYFIRQNEIEDTFKIAEILANDSNEHVQKVVGSWIREAGKRDENKLKDYLNKYSQSLPRITLRYAIEKFDPDMKKHYLGLGK